MIKETAITAFAIVGLMYIFQKHSIEIKKSEELIKKGQIEQRILESNLTLLEEKKGLISSKNRELLSKIEVMSSTYRAKIDNLNQVLVEKDKYIKKESDKRAKELMEAEELSQKIKSELDTKEAEVTELLSQKSDLEENLTIQIEQNSLLEREKEKIEKRVAELLTVDKIKNFDSLLSQIDNLEANITAEIEKETQLKEEYQNLQNIHQEDIEEYQSLLAQYKTLELNLTNELQKEFTLTDEKSQLESKLDSEIQNRRDLELKLAEEIENENRIKDELAKELEQEEKLRADLNKTIETNTLLVDKDKKLELEMSELLFISKDSREKAEAEHQLKIKELESKLAIEIEKEQNLEANLTAEIEKENLLKEEKESASSDAKAQIEALSTTLAKEIDKSKNLESNLSTEIEKENILLDEKSKLETKISKQSDLAKKESQKIKSKYKAEVEKLEKKLATELQNEQTLESNLTAKIGKEKQLEEEKIGLESNITGLLATIEEKKREIEAKEELRAEAITKIEALTKKRDELEELNKEKISQLTTEQEATKTALLEVEKVKNEMKNLREEIAKKKRAEENRLAEEKKVAKESLLEAFELTKVEFEVNSMKLTKKSEELLNTTAEVMKKYPDFKYNIQGHTDNRGNEKFNIKLSGKRAEQVKKYLISRGIRAEILSTEGIGSAEPIADNNTTEGRILNRRVVFQILKD